MKIQGNKEYGQDGLQQVEVDAKYSAASSLNPVLSPNAELQTPHFSPQPSSLAHHHLFTDVCVGLLNQGQGVRFKANGWSMQPTICDGEMINVEPVPPSQIRHGDIVLYRGPHGITAHRVVHIEKEMELHQQTSDPIQPPMWGDISRLSSGQTVLRRHIPSSAGANSALSPQPSVKLSGHWVIRLLGHFWVSLSPNSQRRTPNVSNHSSIALCPMRHALYVSPSSLRTPNAELRTVSVSPRHSSLIFYTRGDSLMADDFPVMSDQLLGKVFSVERNGRAIALYGTRAFMLQEMRLFLFTLKRYVVHALSGVKVLFSKKEKTG